MHPKIPKCKHLTIFEGPDGSGKTTTALAYAKATGALYVHFDALPNVRGNLARMYVEAMIPALLGYQDVVFDRSWFSEIPYGRAFRGGDDRVGASSLRMLNRIAMKCGALVIHCRPEFEVCAENFNSRRGVEMLDSVAQLRVVYDSYGETNFGLNTVDFDYTKVPPDMLPISPIITDHRRPPAHPVSWSSAGNLKGRIVVVGTSSDKKQDCDPLIYMPYVCFDPGYISASRAVTSRLAAMGVREQEVLWLDANQDLEMLYDLHPDVIFAVGDDACKALYNLKIMAISVNDNFGPGDNQVYDILRNWL
jgi:hypothetical protein